MNHTERSPEGKRLTKISELKKRWMADPEFRKEYEKADEEFAVIEALIRARINAKLSQAELGACLSSDFSSWCESDSLLAYEQGFSSLED